MCDLHSKLEEDRAITAAAIVDNRYFGQTHRQTDIHSSDLISVQCHALHLQTITLHASERRWSKMLLLVLSVRVFLGVSVCPHKNLKKLLIRNWRNVVTMNSRSG